VADWLVRTEGGERDVPAFSFLLVQPAAVRLQLLAIVDAVRTTGPDRWNDTTSYDSMRGVCANSTRLAIDTARCTNRLYLRRQREHRRVVIVDGGAKQNSTTLPDSFYDELAALAATAERDPPPFATADDFARIALDQMGDQ